MLMVLWKISNFIAGNPATFQLLGSTPSGNYAGGGLFIREADKGWPIIKKIQTVIISGNKNDCAITKKIKSY